MDHRHPTPNLHVRLALRVEGDKWNAYLAQQGTMDGAIWLGSILLQSVSNPERKQAFMALMQATISDATTAVFGARPEWPNPPERAPESERSGSA